MHKSIIIFVSLLLILLPLGNSLNISNANAIADVDNSDRKQVSVSSIKCINDNININGVNSGDVNAGNDKGITEEGNLGAYSSKNGEGYYYNDNKSFDCSVSNKNTNTNTVSTTGSGAGSQTVPPTPTEPTTASLTVKKQVFGCETPLGSPMNCEDLQNNSTEWLNCNNISSFSNPIFCQSLPESLFDIEVLDDQNTQIQQFEGSENGTTIQNLEPGTYTVNEIENPTFVAGQLVEDPDVEASCKSAGFSDGGILNYVPPGINSILNYDICFEYEDEEGNDCSEITLAAGEERTCIVKNYIRSGFLE